MEATVEKIPLAWQPLTGRGVAAFARARFSRLFLVQFVVALLAAATVVWFLQGAWFPTVRAAIRHLPPQGEIRNAKLEWRGESPVRLAEGPLLAFAVDLAHGGEARSPAHLQVEFGRADVRIISLLGFLSKPYPSTWIISFNRTELEPWWGAWSPAILAIVALAVIAGLLVTWAVLATVYSLAVWLVAFFADRELSLSGSWRLAGASLMPGALFFCAAIVVYGLGGWDLVRLAIASAAHIVIGWVYAAVSPLCLPRRPTAVAPAGNPFTTPVAEPAPTQPAPSPVPPAPPPSGAP